ncbi:hypothetical protein GGS24DRAFT_442147 [Hypoxylon argillaceum]|nr:hypothetical protein GGS24DRAFT_442147 [Hypoxylon argillaceum]KAI1156486.1 hypothetical protein F4825DRAFT_402791 [Nemania diffusa]
MMPVLSFTVFIAGAASMAIAPSLNSPVIEERHVHSPLGDHHPTVDGTSTRAQWVSSYSNDKEDNPRRPTVDATSTRAQWVTSYSNDEEHIPGGPTVDGTSTRAQWVSSYSNDKEDIPQGPTIDETSTRGRWVSRYKAVPSPAASYDGGKSGISDYWLPTGPGYLNLDQLEEGYHAHLVIMEDSSSWVQSGMGLIKRIFGAESI